jgi:hypothetical protein
LSDVSNFNPVANQQVGKSLLSLSRFLLYFLLLGSDIILTEGQKKYHITAPNSKSNDIHRSKLRKTQLESLGGLVHFGTSFAPLDPAASTLYEHYELEQSENISLKKSKLFDHAVELPTKDSESFLQYLWTTKPDDLTDKENALLDIIRHTLTTFHLVLQNNSRLPGVKPPLYLPRSSHSTQPNSKRPTVQWFLGKFTPGGTIKQLNLSKCEFKET